MAEVCISRYKLEVLQYSQTQQQTCLDCLFPGHRSDGCLHVGYLFNLRNSERIIS